MQKTYNDLELWGGVECTINRVGDIYHDQLAWSGHRDRVEQDINRFANLGFRRLRTAIQWEHISDTGWDHADRMLQTVRQLGIRPIVGLLHHGSGPHHTSLLDPGFPQKFAAFALQTAQRYPWIEDYTPINEPQTTGRFACLYGHWFPHHRSMRSYVRALYHQIKGIVLAMEAIRSVQPEARLLHTEDGGRTFASPALERFRVEREQRRWLGLDLLCGHVTKEHRLFGFLLQHDLSEKQILWFAERPCPPAVVGLNYYVTSDRYLDDRLHLYPDFMSGGDRGDEPLVDMEAVRVRREGIAGANSLLTEAWSRYGLPVAITEAHLGCSQEEQVRWLIDIWQGAQEAVSNGVDVRSVTVWALLGLYNWSNLCTEDRDAYEPGVFDVSGGCPAETPLADVARRLSSGKPLHPHHTSTEGWWRRSSRLTMASPMETSVA